MGAAPVAPVRYQHASGDDEDGCMPCWFDQEEQGIALADIRPCTTPEPDPAEPAVCRWCSHTVAPEVPSTGLSCGDCESSPCRCAP